MIRICLIAVNPTRGLDVGAIEFVHRYLVEQRNKNKAVLLVSFELDEIMSVSDRIEVIFDGQITGSMPAAGADEKDPWNYDGRRKDSMKHKKSISRRKYYLHAVCNFNGIF